MALIFHILLIVMIRWMEGIIWEGIKFLFWITCFFSALFPFPGGCREKVGAACGCRHMPTHGSNRRCWLLAFAVCCCYFGFGLVFFEDMYWSSPRQRLCPGTMAPWVKAAHYTSRGSKLSVLYYPWVNLTLFLGQIVYAVSTHNICWLLFKILVLSEVIRCKFQWWQTSVFANLCTFSAWL